MHRYRDLVLLMLALMLVSCAPKAFLWQGQYTKIRTTEQPKEDFKVGDYIVVAYAPCEYKRNASRAYKFALVQRGQQIGLITLDRHEEIGTVYFLEESGYRRGAPSSHMSRSLNHVTYNLYRELPTYERVKSDVTTILLGGQLAPESPQE